MRHQFDQIFETNSDGSITPRSIVKFNGKLVSPPRRLPRGSLFGGILIDDHMGEDVELEKEDGAAIIMGFYPKSMPVEEKAR